MPLTSLGVFIYLNQCHCPGWRYLNIHISVTALAGVYLNFYIRVTALTGGISIFNSGDAKWCDSLTHLQTHTHTDTAFYS